MLYELITSLTTSCPQYVRHMDYLYEVIAMRSRYQRNRTAWEPHLERSRQFVLSAAEECRNRNKAVILGSGLLLDVPLKELSSMFREVVLVDIVSLPEVRRAVRQYRNAKLIQRDVTNMAETLYDNIHHGVLELPRAAPVVPEIDSSTDLVVSLNILSQLWVMPRAYALKKLRDPDEESVDEWCRQIVESHYAFLTSLSCTVCLVADHAFMQRDRQGTTVSQGSTIAGLTLPTPRASWKWDIIPKGENRQFLSKELTVGAWHIRA